MNNLEYNNSKKLVEIAKLFVIHYIKNVHSNFPNLDKELNRINDIANNINFEFVPKNDFQHTAGRHYDEHNLIVFYISKDKDSSNISSLYEAIPTIVHELSHAISSEKKCIFIEEGMISYFTANVIRYAIANPIEIEGINSEELYSILNKQKLTNNYTYPCEFVSNLNIIMSIYNIDAQCEYLFNRNGFQRLLELTETISPDFSNILSHQKNKDPEFSPNTNNEYDYFFHNYIKVNPDYNFELLSDTDIQMNKILMNVLICSGHIKKYPILMQRSLDFIEPKLKEKLLNKDSKKTPLSKEEHLEQSKQSLESIKYDYKIYDSVHTTAKQFNKLLSIYGDISFKYSSLGARDMLSILVAYDMIQKHQPISEIFDISKQYFKLICPNVSYLKILANTVNCYYDNIKDLCADGKDIIDILNEKIYQSCIFTTELPDPQSITLENFWKKIDFIGKNTSKYFDENEVNLFYHFYILSDSISERYFSEDRVFTQRDYNIFSEKLKQIFKTSNYPIYLTHSGLSADFIFVKNFIKHIATNSDNFIDNVISLLNILKNNSLELGESLLLKHRGDELNTLSSKISYAYEKLKEQNSTKKTEEFTSLLNDLCIKDDTLFALTIIPSENLGKNTYLYDQSMMQLLYGLFGKDFLKKYNIAPNEINLEDNDCR